MSENQITYKLGNDLDLDEVISLYRATSLGARRPLDKRDIFAAMIRNANLVVTAWEGDKLVGISRSLTDHVYITYLSDLAVHEDYQKRGIGKRLVEETRKAVSPSCSLTLLAAPQASEYYEPLGFEYHPRAWILMGEEEESQSA